MPAAPAKIATDKQVEFVRLVASGKLAPTDAARAAGYRHPSSDASRLLRLPAISDAIRQGMAARLHNELAPVALNTVADIMRDADAPARLRLDASRVILDRAGYVPPKAQDPGADGAGGLSGMTRDQLAALADKLAQELGDRAQTIDVAPGDAPDIEEK